MWSKEGEYVLKKKEKGKQWNFVPMHLFPASERGRVCKSFALCGWFKCPLFVLWRCPQFRGYVFFKKTHEYFAGTKWTVRDREVSVSVWEVRLYLLKLFFGLSRKVSLEGLRYNPNNGREKKATLSQNDGLLLFITCKRFRWLAKLERKLRSKTTSKYGCRRCNQSCTCTPFSKRVRYLHVPHHVPSLCKVLETSRWTDEVHWIFLGPEMRK